MFTTYDPKLDRKVAAKLVRRLSARTSPKSFTFSNSALDLGLDGHPTTCENSQNIDKNQ
ncbi:hypothetical protein [Enhygromyxa salina]|uniref:hypothetical protein n=1 Tax=Enhygromyxa salina TaxID=215803 RepID=UPI001293AFE2|nr:hypothetical protein [Enhygromyxa salina]